MRDYQVTPLTRLTPDDIDKLILHSTISSLRRAASVTPKLIRVEGNQDIPTIYYIKGVKDPEIQDWTRHALVTDVQRYLLRNGINSDDSDESQDSTDSDDSSEDIEYTRSRIVYDGYTGKGSIWNEPVHDGRFNEHLRFEGCNILYGEVNGNYGYFLGIFIVADQEMVDRYPNGEVELPDYSRLSVHEAFNEFYEGQPAFHYYCEIEDLNNTGPEYRIHIQWDKEFEESFVAIVYGEEQDQDHACHLEG